MRLEIFDAKQNLLTDEDVRSIVEIEQHPKVREWLIEHVDLSVEKELQAYKLFFRNLPENARVDILVAKCDGRLAGFLGLWRLGRYMEHVASVGVSVHPNYWRKGIATHLIRSAIVLAKERGLKRLEIETLSENVAMKHVAEKLGFRLESLRKNRIQKDGSYYDEADYFLLL